MYLLEFRPRPSGKGLYLYLIEVSGKPPPYAILSHTWTQPSDAEVEYKDLIADRSVARFKPGYQKIEKCCERAIKDGLNHAWIDTCCIDKSSSAELSEAINSMFQWYESAEVCYAYLQDVSASEDHHALKSSFRLSRWFTRGWTLQELIAPRTLKFFDNDWTYIGNKLDMASLVEEITNVDEAILRDSGNLSKASVAQKISWASSRKTTRVEDKAYSLIGLFGVSLPTIYGEGSRAFIRLQEEIMRVSTDQTIFAWQGNNEGSGMLATSPEMFSESAGYVPMTYSRFADRFGIEATIQKPDFAMTNFGLRIQLPIVKMPDYFQHLVFAILACHRGNEERPTIIFLHQHPDRPSSHFYRTLFNGRSLSDANCGSLESCPFWMSRFDREIHVRIQTIWVSRGETRIGKQLGIDCNQTRYEFCMTASKGLISSADAAKIVDVYPPELFSTSETGLQALRGMETAHHASVVFSSTKQDRQRLAFVFGIHNWCMWFDIFTFGFGGTAQSIAEEYDLFDLTTRKSRCLRDMMFIGDLRQGQVQEDTATPWGYVVKLLSTGTYKEGQSGKTEKFMLNLCKQQY
jgi:hypothetical protein